MISKENFTKEAIIRSGMIYTSSVILNRAVAAINIFVIVYFLSVYEYGVFKLVLSLVGMFQSFIISGLDGVVRNDIAIDLKRNNKERATQVFYEFLFVKLLLSVLVWVVLYLVIIFIFADLYDNNFISILKIASVTILLNYINDVFSLFFKSIGALSWLSKINSILEIVKLLILLIFFYVFSPSVYILIISIIVTQLITHSVYFFVTRSMLLDWWKSFHFSLPNNVLNIIRTYGKWSILSNILSDILANSRNYMIKFLISTEAVAIYSIAKSMIESLYQLLPMNKILMIFLPYKITKEDLKVVYYKMGIKYSTYLYIILMILGYIGGTLVINIFFAKYVSSLPIFYLMLPVFLLFGLSDFISSYLHVMRFQKILFFRTLLKNITVILLTFTLVPYFGILGLGYEYIITNIVLVLSLYLFLQKKYPELKLNLRDFKLTRDDLSLIYRRLRVMFKSNLPHDPII